MNQHPIPQNVTQYEFKLIGFMTLKQFGMLGGFLLLAFIITKLPLIPGIFTWPIAVSFALLGFAIAFVPYEERTLDVWLINFVKSIYSPTQYLWKKQIQIPNYFNFSPTKKNNTEPVIRKSPKTLNSYSQTITTNNKNSLDKKEEAATDKFNSLFDRVDIPIQKQTLEQNSTPQVQEKSSQKPAGDQPRIIKTPPTKSQVQNVLFQNQVKLTQKKLNTQGFEDSMATQKQKQEAQKIENNLTQKNTNPQIQNNSTIQPNQPLIQKAPPLTPPIEVQSSKKQDRKARKAITPQFLSDISMPITPSAPNIIVGMTITPNEKLISNAIIEISDKNNIPVRAVKSNNLGQFFIATPVKNGLYSISIEHQNYKFDTIKIEAKGEIIPPLKITSIT